MKGLSDSSIVNPFSYVFMTTVISHNLYTILQIKGITKNAITVIIMNICPGSRKSIKITVT